MQGYSFYGFAFKEQNGPVQQAIHARKQRPCPVGFWRARCDQPVIDTHGGLYTTPEQAMKYGQKPRYKVCNTCPPDEIKAKNWDENPPAGVKMPYECQQSWGMYAQEGGPESEGCESKVHGRPARVCNFCTPFKCSSQGSAEAQGYCQEGSSHITFRDGSQYHLPQDVRGPCPLNLSETQMLQPPIASTVELLPTPLEIMPCGGFFAVDSISKQVVERDYYMGPSDGYPNKASAEYAAYNLVLPNGMTVFRTL